MTVGMRRTVLSDAARTVLDFGPSGERTASDGVCGRVRLLPEPVNDGLLQASSAPSRLRRELDLPSKLIQHALDAPIHKPRFVREAIVTDGRLGSETED